MAWRLPAGLGFPLCSSAKWDVQCIILLQPVRPDDVDKTLACCKAITFLADPCPSWLVKSARAAQIISMSLQEGCMPSCFKETIAWPVLRKTKLSPNNINNFRPIANILLWASSLREQWSTSCRRSWMTPSISIGVQSTPWDRISTGCSPRWPLRESERGSVT